MYHISIINYTGELIIRSETKAFIHEKLSNNNAVYTV